MLRKRIGRLRARIAMAYDGVFDQTQPSLVRPTETQLVLT